MSEALALPCAVMKMRRGRVASQAVLMAAFAASVVAFCAAASYTEGRLRSVDLRLDTIAEETMPETFAAACGEGVLARVLGNLLRNAVAHMGDATTRQILVRRHSASTARIEIEDTGPGIREEDLERVFQPYARGCKTGGHGLGLATVQRLVNAHGGMIAVRPRAGGGTVFSVALPPHVRTT